MSSRSILPWLAVIVIATGCREGSAPERLTLTRQAGDNQMAAAGTPVAVPPSARVTADGGSGVAGVTVLFAVASGGGSVTGATQTTNADGIATVGGWTLGESTGQNTLTATVENREVEGSPLTFTAQGTAGAAAKLEKQAGDNQSSAVATPVVTPPSVLVTDQFDNPVAGVDVVFMVASGGGSISGSNPTTGADGLATVGSWVLGEIAGENTLTAQSPGLGGSPATFTATADADQAATMSVVEGNNQSAAVGTAVPVAPRIRTQDAFGNNVDGVPISFAVSAGGGSVTGAEQSTGADGTAAVLSWMLGPTPGANQLTATANTTGVMGSPIVFDATATALFNVARYLGSWTGTWINNTFSSTGTAAMTISADESAMTVTIAFSVTGNVLGTGGGAPTQSNMTAYDDGGFTANVTLDIFGTTTITVAADGSITASGVNVPASGIDRWDATGTISDTQLILDWTITFSGGGTATGRTTLTKQ